jgi:hypothetical protein
LTSTVGAAVRPFTAPLIASAFIGCGLPISHPTLAVAHLGRAVAGARHPMGGLGHIPSQCSRVCSKESSSTESRNRASATKALGAHREVDSLFRRSQRRQSHAYLDDITPCDIGRAEHRVLSLLRVAVKARPSTAMPPCSAKPVCLPRISEQLQEAVVVPVSCVYGRDALRRCLRGSGGGQPGLDRGRLPRTRIRQIADQGAGSRNSSNSPTRQSYSFPVS